MTPINYTLNFLWINLNPQNRIADQSIFDDESETINEQNFTYQLCQWANFHANRQINLWYDSALVTKKAQLNSFCALTKISQEKNAKLKLKDIRRLPNLNREIEILLHPATPVYYRVDFIKALIVDKMMLSSKNFNYCIISDIDVKPMTFSQIFDPPTLNDLNSIGYVLAQSTLQDYENGFVIFNTTIKNVRKAHYQSIIKSIVREILHQRKFLTEETTDRDYFSSEIVYCKYIEFELKMVGLNAGPRKKINCSESEFNFSRDFLKSDHRSERFRFMHNSSVPYTKYGRNLKNPPLEEESQIKELIDWRAEALPKNISI